MYLYIHICKYVFHTLKRETFHHEVNTVFTASISSLLWSNLILKRSFQPLFGNRLGRSKSRGRRLAKRPPLARNDNGSGREEFTCCESEMTGFLMRLWEAWDRVRNPGWTWGSDPRKREEDGALDKTVGTGEWGSGRGWRVLFGTRWIWSDYETSLCQMEKLKRKLGIFLVEHIR